MEEDVVTIRRLKKKHKADILCSPSDPIIVESDGYGETIEVVCDGIAVRDGVYTHQEGERMEEDVLCVKIEKSKTLETHSTSELQYQENDDSEQNSDSDMNNDNDTFSDSEALSSEYEDTSGSCSESDTECKMKTDQPWEPITRENHASRPIPFLAIAGVKYALPNDSKPVDYVKLFITDSFIHSIVAETNRYSKVWIGQNQAHLKSHPKSRLHQWKRDGQTTAEEIYALLAVLINMGLVRKANVSEYWDQSHPSQATPWFSQLFHRERFQLILKFLQFTDVNNLPPVHDRFAKIQPVIDHFKGCFSKYFHPERDITVMEDTYEFKENTEGKGSQITVNIMRLCDVETGYTTTFEVTKSSCSLQEELGYQLVTKLMQQSDLLYCGHHLNLPKDLCTPDLLFDLYDKGTTATGIARNHSNLPKQCVQVNLKAKEVSEWRQGPLLCVTHRLTSKKQTLLSTASSAGYVKITTRRGTSVKKPQIVVDHGKIANAMSQKDNDIYSLMFERRTMKWTTLVTLSLISTAMLNAYVLYTKQTTHNPLLTRRQFMVSVIESFASDYLELSKAKAESKAEKKKVTTSPSQSPTKIIKKRVTGFTSQSSSLFPARNFAPTSAKKFGDSSEKKPRAKFAQSCSSSSLSFNDASVQKLDDAAGQSCNSSSPNLTAVPKQNLASRSHKKLSSIRSQDLSAAQVQNLSNTKAKRTLEKAHVLVRRKGDQKKKCSGIINHNKTFRTRLMCKQCNIGMCRLCYPKHLEKFST